MLRCLIYFVGKGVCRQVHLIEVIYILHLMLLESYCLSCPHTHVHVSEARNLTSTHTHMHTHTLTRTRTRTRMHNEIIPTAQCNCQLCSAYASVGRNQSALVARQPLARDDERVIARTDRQRNVPIRIQQPSSHAWNPGNKRTRNPHRALSFSNGSSSAAKLWKHDVGGGANRD